MNLTATAKRSPLLYDGKCKLMDNLRSHFLHQLFSIVLLCSAGLCAILATAVFYCLLLMKFLFFSRYLHLNRLERNKKKHF